MGIDRNLYIGPYLRVREVVEQKTVDNCAGHNFPNDAIYCPQCGKHKNNRFVNFEKNNAPNYWQERFEKNGESVNFDDYMVTTSCMADPTVEIIDGKRVKIYIYYPNRSHEELNLPRIQDNDEQNIPFDGLDIQGTLKKFKEIFSDEIAFLKQWFEVEIKFGFLSWYS